MVYLGYLGSSFLNYFQLAWIQISFLRLPSLHSNCCQSRMTDIPQDSIITNINTSKYRSSKICFPGTLHVGQHAKTLDSAFYSHGFS